MSNEYLSHHGVKGMKWGVRKEAFNKNAKRAANSNADKNYNKAYKKIDRITDEYVYGKRGVDRINKRMNKGQSYLKASTIEMGRSFVKSALVSFGTADIATGGMVHRAVGKKIVDSYMKSKAAKSVVKISQNHYFDPIDVPFKTVN